MFCLLLLIWYEYTLVCVFPRKVPYKVGVLSKSRFCGVVDAS